MSDDKQWDDDNNDNDYYYVSNEDDYDVFHLKSLGFETIHLGNLLAQSSLSYSHPLLLHTFVLTSRVIVI